VNILLCNQWFSPYSPGGVSIYNKNLVKGLSKKANEVIVVSSLEDGLPKHEIKEGVHIYRLRMPELHYWFSRMPLIGPQNRFLRNFLYSHSVCRFLRRVNQEQKIDLIEYADINGEGFFHRRYLASLPYVIRCHSPYYLLGQAYERGEMQFSCRFINWMERRTIRQANGISAPSRDLANRIEEWCGLPKNRVIPIPNPIDTNFFHPDSNHAATGVIKILFVGRIERAKGVFVLADAIPRVLRISKNVKFIFAGGWGNSQVLNHLKNHLDQSGCLSHCEFPGLLLEEELRKFYQHCDIFVNPSTLYESFSYTNAEAMACGKPVVTSDMGGMPEIVGHTVGGLIFRSTDSNDLAEKLSILIKDNSLRRRLGEQARRKSLDYSTERVIDRMIALYKNLS